MIVLVSRPLGLGDFLTGLPALAMIRAACPGERVVLAVDDAYRDLALLSGSVDATVHGHELEPFRDPPRHPELAVDLHGNGPESRALLAATGPRRLVAFGVGEVAWDPDEHEVTRWCRLVRDGLPARDVPVPSVVGALPVPPGVTAPVGRTVIHCGAKSVSRRWPADRFAQVAAVLAGAGHDVLVTGGAGEAETVAGVAAWAGVEGTSALSLPELLAVTAHARLVVCGDTGVAHVATNYATPSVVLFGPVSPAVWGPPPLPRHQVLWHGDGRGDPHGRVLDPALAAITVDEVLVAARRALAAAADDQAADDQAADDQVASGVGLRQKTAS